MKWLETIRVQKATGFDTAMEKELEVMMRDFLTKTRGPGLEEAYIYNHVSVPGYFTICLTWETEVPQTKGSLIGLNLSQAWKAFGLVDHSVWVEKE